MKNPARIDISLGEVTTDLNERLAEIDSRIRTEAYLGEFEVTVALEVYERNERIPEVVYEITRHLTYRGFVCVYNGDEGSLRISWRAPNMTQYDVERVTRASRDMIPELGQGYQASLLYLCLTSGRDLRQHTYTTIMRSLSGRIRQASVAGGTSIMWGFEGVSFSVVAKLYPGVIASIIEAGYEMLPYNDEFIRIRWGLTLNATLRSGETLLTELE